MKRDNLRIIRSSPGRRQVNSIYLRCQLKEIHTTDLNIGNIINSSIINETVNLSPMHIISNEHFTRICQLNSIPTSATKAIKNSPININLTRDILRNCLRRNTVPGLLIKTDTLIKPLKEKVPLVPVLIQL